MRVLVTGGAGFIGSAYVRGLLRLDGARVTVLDKLTYAGHRTNLDPVRDHPGLSFVHGDICDPQLIDGLMREHDAVVHFAAETHVDRSIAASTVFAHTNVLGTQTLLDAAYRHDVGRFVQVSTDEVYGSIDVGSWHEASPIAPRSPYAATKAGADLLALAYHHTHGLPVTVTRCSNNYGCYQHPEKLIPLFITRLLAGRTVPLYGDGRHIRDWLHVTDHCRGIQLVLERGRAGEVYHVGGDAEMTNTAVTEMLLAATGRDWSAVVPVPDRKGHDRRYSLAADKIESELGYRPSVPFADGIERTVAWYRAHESWWKPLVTMPEDDGGVKS